MIANGMVIAVGSSYLYIFQIASYENKSMVFTVVAGIDDFNRLQKK